MVEGVQNVLGTHSNGQVRKNTNQGAHTKKFQWHTA